jgi:ribonuclease R
VTAQRSGDSIGLGERMMVEVIDAAILRRTVYGRRVVGEGDDAPRPHAPHTKGKKRVFEARSTKPERGKAIDKRVRAGKRKIDSKAARGKKSKGGGRGKKR